MTIKLKKPAAFLLCLILLAQSAQILGFDTFYSHTESEYISKGVLYEESRRITDMGLLDVFTLRIPANDPDLLLSAAASGDAGLKETASKLLTDTSAIAGVNGDYFGTAGSYSMPQGLQVDVNGVLSVSNNANTGAAKYSSFMLAEDGNYFMGYINAGVRFLNNGAENIVLGSINKVADLAGPSCLTYDFMQDTSEIDARIEGAVKIVVRGDYISYISAKGETVEVPWDGYVIIMNSTTADQVLWNFAVGQRAELIVDSGVDIMALQSAISGGGRILVNGALVTEGSQYVSGVHPRTAIGFTEDMSEIIIMVVDGRTHSVGVTHEQTAQLMLEAGAYNAMHLDGGGSTEMLVKKPGQDALDLVNYPSGGFERKLINALGLYVKQPPGEIQALFIDPNIETVITAVPTKVQVYGLDEYMRKIEIPPDQISISGNSNAGYSGGYFTAYESGSHTITAAYGSFTASMDVYATQIYELRPNVKEIKTSVGGKTKLTFTGVGQNGSIFQVDPAAVNVQIHPEGLGEIINGEFMPTSVGQGWIRCSVGEVYAYIPVYATIVALNIDPLNGTKPMSFSAYPETVTGAAYYTTRPDYFQSVGQLTYHFNPGDYTQAAYADLTGITENEAMGFRMAVYGDLSGNWLRGQVTDAKGDKYLIDFAEVINWDGWKDVEAWLPDGVLHPVTLDRVYVASTSSEEEVLSQIYFCNLRGLYDKTSDFPGMEVPESNVFKDDLNVVFYDWTEYGYDITFMADAAAPPEGQAFHNRAMDVFLYNSSVAMYMGEYGENFQSDRNSILAQNKTVLVEYKPEYSMYGLDNLCILQMSAAGADGNKGLMFSDKSQWSKITQAIEGSYTNNVMIMTDISPMDFSNEKEFELLHSILKDYVRAGKKVFVLSKGNAGADVSVMDGVRYITLGPLYRGEDPNTDFSVLRLRISGNDIRYSIENINQ